MEWLTPALEEYKSLRAESLASMANQQSTLRIGIGAVGVVIAAGFNLWEKTLLPDVIFLIYNPVICYLALLIWVGEVARMMRAGYYLSRLEKKINASFPEIENVLSWENWINTRDALGRIPKRIFGYYAVIGLFFFAAFSSIIVANYKIIDKMPSYLLLLIDFFEAVFFILVLVFIIRAGKDISGLYK